MSIQADFEELYRIHVEIQRLNGMIKNLKTHSKGVEARIIQYCEDNQLPGVRYKDTTLIVKNVKKTKPLNKKEKIERLETLLRTRDMSMVQPALILETMKSDGNDYVQKIAFLK